MFTGLVEEIGEIIDVSKGSNSSKLTIRAKKITKDMHIGDSIAVNGTCLTVVKFQSDFFSVDVMAETIRMGSFKNLKCSSLVNLERALKVGDRIGGHMVSGHIDGTGSICDIHREDISTWICIEAPGSILKYVVLKGSICIDGVSLTVARINKNSFSVSIIPHTKQETILSYKHLGDYVNIECDMIGKYVERMISPKFEDTNMKSCVNMSILEKYGFT